MHEDFNTVLPLNAEFIDVKICVQHNQAQNVYLTPLPKLLRIYIASSRSVLVFCANGLL